MKNIYNHPQVKQAFEILGNFRKGVLSKEAALEKLNYLKEHSETGAVGAIVSVVIGIVVASAVIVALWPTFVGTDTTVQALTQTDTGTTMLQTLWPILLTVVGLGAAVSLVIGALKHFGLMD